MNKLEELYLQMSQRSGSYLHLDEIKKIDALIGSPSRASTTIHIAGTNGKGSVATKIAHTLTGLGFRTGLYTSPHISSFRERIVIDGKMIEEKIAFDLMSELLKLSPDLTFFEILTLLAFVHFSKSKVDYAVIETGMGGALDATNIIKPILSVITNIEKDHMHALGPTLDDVAKNKAGIIKLNTPVVLGYRAARKPIIKEAFSKKAPIYFVREKSNYINENEAIAKRALDFIVLGTEFEMSKSTPPCRLEVRKLGSTTVIFDVAHNTDGLNKVFSEIKSRYCGQNIHTIFGISTNKDCSEMLNILKKESADLHYVENEHPRVCPLEEIQKELPDINYLNLEQFVAQAVAKEGIILVVGSFFIMHDMKEKLGFNLKKDLLLLCD